MQKLVVPLEREPSQNSKEQWLRHTWEREGKREAEAKWGEVNLVFPTTYMGAWTIQGHLSYSPPFLLKFPKVWIFILNGKETLQNLNILT